jgi:hypothetical protein
MSLDATLGDLWCEAGLPWIDQIAHVALKLDILAPALKRMPATPHRPFYMPLATSLPMITLWKALTKPQMPRLSFFLRREPTCESWVATHLCAEVDVARIMTQSARP